MPIFLAVFKEDPMLMQGIIDLESLFPKLFSEESEAILLWFLTLANLQMVECALKWGFTHFMRVLTKGRVSPLVIAHVPMFNGVKLRTDVHLSSKGKSLNWMGPFLVSFFQWSTPTSMVVVAFDKAGNQHIHFGGDVVVLNASQVEEMGVVEALEFVKAYHLYDKMPYRVSGSLVALLKGFVPLVFNLDISGLRDFITMLKTGRQHSTSLAVNSCASHTRVKGDDLHNMTFLRELGLALLARQLFVDMSDRVDIFVELMIQGNKKFYILRNESVANEVTFQTLRMVCICNNNHRFGVFVVLKQGGGLLILGNGASYVKPKMKSCCDKLLLSMQFMLTGISIAFDWDASSYVASGINPSYGFTMTSMTSTNLMNLLILLSCIQFLQIDRCIGSLFIQESLDNRMLVLFLKNKYVKVFSAFILLVKVFCLGTRFVDGGSDPISVHQLIDVGFKEVFVMMGNTSSLPYEDEIVAACSRAMIDNVGLCVLYRAVLLRMRSHVGEFSPLEAVINLCRPLCNIEDGYISWYYNVMHTGGILDCDPPLEMLFCCWVRWSAHYVMLFCLDAVEDSKSCCCVVKRFGSNVGYYYVSRLQDALAKDWFAESMTRSTGTIGLFEDKLLLVVMPHQIMRTWLKNGGMHMELTTFVGQVVRSKSYCACVYLCTACLINVTGTRGGSPAGAPTWPA